MIHWYGLCWRNDREPHNLMHKALETGLSDADCATKLAEWASRELGLTASLLLVKMKMVFLGKTYDLHQGEQPLHHQMKITP